MADKWDFNSLQKDSMSIEEAKECVKAQIAFVDKAVEEKKATLASKTPEAKLAWARVALLNNIANIEAITHELLLPQTHQFLEALPIPDVKYEEVEAALLVLHESAMLMSGLICSAVELLIYWQNKDKQKAEEVKTLKSMMGE